MYLNVQYFLCLIRVAFMFNSYCVRALSCFHLRFNIACIVPYKVPYEERHVIMVFITIACILHKLCGCMA